MQRVSDKSAPYLKLYYERKIKDVNRATFK